MRTFLGNPKRILNRCSATFGIILVILRARFSKRSSNSLFVMPGLVPGIHVLCVAGKQGRGWAGETRPRPKAPIDDRLIHHLVDLPPAACAKSVPGASSVYKNQIRGSAAMTGFSRRH